MLHINIKYLTFISTLVITLISNPILRNLFNYVICPDNDSACSKDNVCCKREDNLSYSCCSIEYCCCKKGKECCACKIPTVRNEINFIRERDNKFSLQKYYSDNDTSNSTVEIIFLSIPQCHGSILYIPSPDKFIQVSVDSRAYPLNSTFTYKGNCDDEHDSFSFSFTEKQDNSREEIRLNIVYKSPPYSKGNYLFSGESNSQILIEIDNIYDKEITIPVESLRIEFKNKPVKGNLYLNSEEEVKINVPYSQHTYIYRSVNAVHSTTVDSQFDEILNFVIVNGYDLRSENYKIVVKISSSENFWLNLFKAIGIVFGALAAITGFLYTLFKCYNEKLCCMKDKSPNKVKESDLAFDKLDNIE